MIEVTTGGGEAIVLEGDESPTLRRVLAACQLLGVESQRSVPSADLRCAAVWVLLGGHRLSSRVRLLRASGFRGWLCVVETISFESEGEANLLDAGADGYSSEPVDPNTFAARLRALLRHGSGKYAAHGTAQAHLRESERLLLVGDNTYVMSPRELTLLKYLCDRAGSWVTRDQLLRDVFGAQKGHDPSIVRTHLSNIKKKLRSDHWILRSDRVAGVMFVAWDAPAAQTDAPRQPEGARA